MLVAGRFYIVFSMYAFSEIICDLLCSVNGCYVLHSDSVVEAFEPF